MTEAGTGPVWPLRYAVITPCRNERENLPRLADALAAQVHPPETWLIVDDGSTDGTPELAAELAERHSWVSLVDRAPRARRDISTGRREGRDLEAFRFGIDELPADVDVVVKVDADLSFETDYFQRLIACFASDPTLGMASGTCYELVRGEWRRRRIGELSVWGASRAYRSACIDVIDHLEPKMGWDGLDEIMVQLRGYRTQCFVDLPFRHHRPEGGRERGRLHARSVQGRASWYMGYRPTYLVVRAVYRAMREPAALAMIWGYVAAAVAHTPQCSDTDLILRLRERQRARHILRAAAV